MCFWINPCQLGIDPFQLLVNPLRRELPALFLLHPYRCDLELSVHLFTEQFLLSWELIVWVGICFLLLLPLALLHGDLVVNQGLVVGLVLLKPPPQILQLHLIEVVLFLCLIHQLLSQRSVRLSLFLLFFRWIPFLIVCQHQVAKAIRSERHCWGSPSVSIEPFISIS